MCGIAGIFNTDIHETVNTAVLTRMTEKLAHRGPDDCRYFQAGNAGLGFRRLSLIDLAGGDQPMFNEDRNIVTICNGEIFNYAELREKLVAKGHHFRTRCDCEVLPHLYEEYGMGLLDHLNGQFALAVLDLRQNELHIARDPFGINPLYYAFVNGVFVFASEIKSIIEHPMISREVDVVGLDHALCFPGVLSPRTVFKDVNSVETGHCISVTLQDVTNWEYWALEYPTIDQIGEVHDEKFYIERLAEELLKSVALRLRADVPTGLYLSGGLDSSLVAGMCAKVAPELQQHTFSIAFPGQEMCEGSYQRRVAERLKAIHHEVPVDSDHIVQQLEKAVYHAETPLKETFDTACLALSRRAREANVPVILTGQGSDELFAGYIGYRFDRFQAERPSPNSLFLSREQELRRQLWGDPNLIYDNNYAEMEQLKTDFFSDEVNEQLYDQNAFSSLIVNPARLAGRHVVHKRSYLDLKMRLADHLLSEHGDRMAMAHGIELRHPFLDVNVVRFATQVPPELKLNGYAEKYIVKQVARSFIDGDIVNREKFGWYAPGSPVLLRTHREWMDDMLSYDRIARQGFFNPDMVEQLKQQYSQEGFKLSQPFESDLLMLVLTFNILLDTFDLSRPRVLAQAC